MSIISDLEDDPDDIAPIFNVVVYPDNPHEYTDAHMPTSGCMASCTALIYAEAAFWCVGSDDVTPKKTALIKTPEQQEKLAMQIPESVAWIYRF